MHARLKALYDGDSPAAVRFRYSLLALDIATVSYFIVGAVWVSAPQPLALTIIFGLYVLLDFALRLWLADRTIRLFTQVATWADLLVMASLLAPLFVDNLSFLRVVRMLRLLRSYHLLRELRRNSQLFRRHEDVIRSAVNLFVFLFVVTAMVFVLEAETNPEINTFVDALYFTVTTLTTTGFGDITMRDTEGRLIAVIIMVFGVALFLRLVQTLFRPIKVFFPCPDCGLTRHDPDAVHCKHCGAPVKIRTEGIW